jgi:hypothetical protein
MPHNGFACIWVNSLKTHSKLLPPSLGFRQSFVWIHMMLDDANVTISQMRTIKQYLRRCFGNKLFIPDYKIRDDVARNLTMPNYGTMPYMSQTAKEEKKLPEAIDF